MAFGGQRTDHRVSVRHLIPTLHNSTRQSRKATGLAMGRDPRIGQPLHIPGNFPVGGPSVSRLAYAGMQRLQPLVKITSNADKRPLQRC
jgi:hypothetical protein